MCFRWYFGIYCMSLIIIVVIIVVLIVIDTILIIEVIIVYRSNNSSDNNSNVFKFDKSVKKILHFCIFGYILNFQYFFVCKCNLWSKLTDKIMPLK